MIKTIIFDLGRVIVDFNDKIPAKALMRYTKHSQATIHSTLFCSKHYESFTLGRITAAEFYATIKKELRLTCSFSKFKFIWNNIFARRENVEKLIKKLKKNKYKLLLLSDTDKLHFEFILKNYPIIKEFDDVVVSYKHNCKKPSKKIFFIALKKAKELANAEPAECLYFDDLVENIIGAKKLGISAVQYASYNELHDSLTSIGIKI